MKKAPTDGHLKHRAIISSTNYKQIDDENPLSHTDARALSLGMATWNRNEISAKIWRHNGSQWKGSSEEMPLHRALDCTIMIIATMIGARDGNLENHFLDLAVLDISQMQTLNKFLLDNKDKLDERLAEIKLLLSKY